jgi:hypothetical protein
MKASNKTTTLLTFLCLVFANATLLAVDENVNEDTGASPSLSETAPLGSEAALNQQENRQLYWEMKTPHPCDEDDKGGRDLKTHSYIDSFMAEDEDFIGTELLPRGNTAYVEHVDGDDDDHDEYDDDDDDDDDSGYGKGVVYDKTGKKGGDDDDSDYGKKGGDDDYGKKGGDYDSGKGADYGKKGGDDDDSDYGKRGEYGKKSGDDDDSGYGKGGYEEKQGDDDDDDDGYGKGGYGEMGDDDDDDDDCGDDDDDDDDYYYDPTRSFRTVVTPRCVMHPDDNPCEVGCGHGVIPNPCKLE